MAQATLKRLAIGVVVAIGIGFFLYSFRVKAETTGEASERTPYSAYGEEPTAEYVKYSEVATLPEGSNRSITVELSPTSSETLTLTYSVLTGTATLGTDFTLSPAQLVFAPGQVSQTLTITSLPDATIEGLETATLQLQNQQTGASDVVTLSFNEGLVTISNAPARLAATADNGRYVVFYEVQNGRVGLYSKDLATNTRYELHAPDTVLRTDSRVALSPDGSTVLYYRGSRIFQVPFRGGTSTPLLTAICDATVTFTTDSRYAQLLSSCINGADAIYSINLTTATTSTLVSGVTLADTPLAVSPDGNVAVYQQMRMEEVEALHVVSTIGNAPTIIHQTSAYAAFDSPTTFLYIPYYDPPRVLTRFDVTTATATPIFTLPEYWVGFHYEPTRHTLYYRTLSYALNRYKIGALNADSMGGRAVSAWLQPVADNTQFLFYQEHTQCHRYGCDVISTNLGTVSAAGDEWYSSLPAYRAHVSPDGRALVYERWDLPALYQKTFVPMMAERRITAFSFAPREFSELHTGNHRIFAVLAATLQSTALYEETPAITHFRNTQIPSLYPDLQFPDILTLLTGDLLYVQDTEGYLYALSDSRPAINSINTEGLLAEGETVTVTVSLDATPLTTATVAIDIVGGTATIGDDVNAPPDTLIFAPFQRERTFTLTATADGTPEPPEELRLAFTPVSGASAGANNTYRLHIADQLYRQHLPLTFTIR